MIRPGKPVYRYVFEKLVHGQSASLRGIDITYLTALLQTLYSKLHRR